jgi:hypothetical protein
MRHVSPNMGSVLSSHQSLFSLQRPELSISAPCRNSPPLNLTGGGWLQIREPGAIIQGAQCQHVPCQPGHGAAHTQQDGPEVLELMRLHALRILLLQPLRQLHPAVPHLSRQHTPQSDWPRESGLPASIAAEMPGQPPTLLPSPTLPARDGEFTCLPAGSTTLSPPDFI